MTLYESKYILYVYIYYILLCMYICIHTNLLVDIIARLLHPLSGDSQGQELFLAPSVDNQIHIYDIYIYIYWYIWYIYYYIHRISEKEI